MNDNKGDNQGRFDRNSIHVATDAVVFAVLNKELKILLIQRADEPFRGKFALPGGMLNIDEEIEDCVGRELEEETGVKGIYLKKLTPVGTVGRDPRGRVITIPFLALVDWEKLRVSAGDEVLSTRWHDAYGLPGLAFDHKRIIEDALIVLRHDILYSDIARQIMPAKFTLTELQHAYEIVLDKKLDKRNFRKKMKELGLLKGLNEAKMEGTHRPARLYSFRSPSFAG